METTIPLWRQINIARMASIAAQEAANDAFLMVRRIGIEARDAAIERAVDAAEELQNLRWLAEHTLGKDWQWILEDAADETMRQIRHSPYCPQED